MCVVCMLFVGCVGLSALTYSGRVTDRKMNPLPGVAVFLNRTTICSVTGEDGTFRIEAPMMFESALVFAKEGFGTEVISNPYEEPEKEKITVVLYPKGSTEEGIETFGSFSRDFFLAEFRANFLGRDSAGLSCVIENEEALVFLYDSALHFVSVAMKRPLQLRNPYLGYRIVAYIENYFFTPLTPLKKESMPLWLRETYSSLRPENVADRPNSFYGFFYFIDEVGSNPLYAQRRLLQDEGSQLHFFRTVRSGTFQNSHYRFYEGEQYSRPELNRINLFTVSDTLNLKRISVGKPTVDPLDFDEDIDADDSPAGRITIFPPIVYTVTYREGRPFFVIRFFTDSFFIDTFGNHSAGALVRLDGGIAMHISVGNRLPANYLPNP